MMLHQPRKRRPRAMEVHLLHAPRLDGVNTQQIFDIGSHALVDQLEQPAPSRVQAIVEIEDPIAYMIETWVHFAGGRRSRLKPLSKLKGFINHKDAREAVYFQRLERRQG
jgi:hypothetical protein